MSTSSFDYSLPNLSTTVKVTLPYNLTQEQLRNFTAFKKWINTFTASLKLQEHKDHKFHSSPYMIKNIDVQSIVEAQPGNIKFIKVQVTVENDKGEWLPGAVFLRGSSVAMIMILQPDDADPASEDDKWALLTVQPRPAAGSLAFTEIPAGMLDNSSFSGAAAKEVEEETSIKITEEELMNMSDLAVPQTTTSDWKTATARGRTSASGTDTELLDTAAYPSPGACDESIPLFLYQKRLPRDIIDSLRDLETGLHDEGEKIILKLVRLENLWREGSRDGKTLAALALYDGLRREGKIPEIETLTGVKAEEMRGKLKEKNLGASKM